MHQCNRSNYRMQKSPGRQGIEMHGSHRAFARRSRKEKLICQEIKEGKTQHRFLNKNQRRSDRKATPPPLAPCSWRGRRWWWAWPTPATSRGTPPGPCATSCSWRPTGGASRSSPWPAGGAEGAASAPSAACGCKSPCRNCQKVLYSTCTTLGLLRFPDPL